MIKTTLLGGTRLFARPTGRPIERKRWLEYTSNGIKVTFKQPYLTEQGKTYGIVTVKGEPQMWELKDGRPLREAEHG